MESFICKVNLEVNIQAENRNDATSIIRDFFSGDFEAPAISVASVKVSELSTSKTRKDSGNQ